MQLYFLIILYLFYLGIIEKKKCNYKINTATQTSSCLHLSHLINVIQSNNQYSGLGQVKTQLRLSYYIKTVTFFLLEMVNAV